MHSSVILKTFRFFLFTSLIVCLFPLQANTTPVLPDSLTADKSNLYSLVDSMRFSAYLPSKFDKNFIKAYNYATEVGLEENLLIILDSLGIAARNHSDYEAALLYHRKAYEIANEIRDASFIARCYNNIGIVYRQMEKFQPAIDYHFKALRLSRELNDFQNMAKALNSIGNINFLLGNYSGALDLLKNALSKEQQSDSKAGMAINLNNIGKVYFAQGNLDTAKYFFQKSLSIYNDLGDLRGQAICNDDIGNVYLKDQKFIEALKYFLKALEINESLNSKRHIAKNYLHIGMIFYHLNEFERAHLYAEKCRQLAEEINSNFLMSECLLLFSDISSAENKYRDALNYFRQAYTFRDSTMNEKNKQFMTRLQTEYESNKQQRDIKLLKNETEIAQLELERRKIISQFAIGMAILLFILLGIIMWFNFNSWRKNKLLREKNEEIFRAQQKEKLNAERLLEAKEVAEQANRTKTLFLANISHEIRTPLNSIIGFTELISHYITDDKQKTYLESIKSSGRSLLSLINDILDLSKIEAGKLDVEYGPVNLKNIFNELKNIFSLKISQKNIDFRIYVDEEMPDSLIMSESRLRQVLFNIIGNSLKFTEEGSVDVIAEVAEYKENNKLDIRITVKDTGIGIAGEDQKRIFEAFSQSMSESMNQAEGTGLGLTISKRLLEIMNGQIELQSELDEGSSFIIRLNDVEVAEQYSFSAEAEELKHGEIVWEPATILVVDDLDLNRELIKDIFSNAPIRIIEAENGQTAIQKAVRYEPDLILMDIRMPVLNGLEATKRIRKMITVRNIPVIAITAYSITEDYERVYQNLFDGVLVKPVQISKLFAELVKFLSYRIEKKPDITVKQTVNMDKKNYDGIRELITDDIKNKWLEVNKTHFVNDIMDFGIKIKELGKRKRSSVLEEYGNILISHTENFNIELMNETLNRFKEFLKTESGK